MKKYIEYRKYSFTAKQQEKRLRNFIRDSKLKDNIWGGHEERTKKI